MRQLTFVEPGRFEWRDVAAPRLAAATRTRARKHWKRGGFYRLLTALLFGAAFSLGWTPCLGPFLGSALMMAGRM